ncbi:hypothetical protein MPSI1_001096 [Malassezia psittaci]|uniref:Mediator of RNA polymerase II transcription subunit 22 n=1 Tax=Malassezia psittaci TaxID=1821823 RepID=A0AAF0JJC8_9BASI|nr:hypothetical protein MPSI1_001096 [Malassezia psittaci]
MDPTRAAVSESDAHAGNSANLDAQEEAVNKRIDADILNVMENYKEILNLSRVGLELLTIKIGAKDHYDVSREAFQLETRADSMVRSVQSLYLLSNALKLSLLLSQSHMSQARNHEVDQLEKQTQQYQQECAELLKEHWLS